VFLRIGLVLVLLIGLCFCVLGDWECSEGLALKLSNETRFHNSLFSMNLLENCNLDIKVEISDGGYNYGLPYVVVVLDNTDNFCDNGLVYFDVEKPNYDDSTSFDIDKIHLFYFSAESFNKDFNAEVEQFMLDGDVTVSAKEGNYLLDFEEFPHNGYTKGWYDDADAGFQFENENGDNQIITHAYSLGGECNNVFKDGEFDGGEDDWKGCQLRKSGLKSGTISGGIYAEAAMCEPGGSFSYQIVACPSDGGSAVPLSGSEGSSLAVCNQNNDKGDAYKNSHWEFVGQQDNFEFDSIYLFANYDWTKAVDDDDDIEKEDAIFRMAFVEGGGDTIHGLRCAPHYQDFSGNFTSNHKKRYLDLFNADFGLGKNSDSENQYLPSTDAGTGIGFGTFYSKNDQTDYSFLPSMPDKSFNFKGTVIDDGSNQCCFGGYNIPGNTPTFVHKSANTKYGFGDVGFETHTVPNGFMSLARNKVICYEGLMYMWPPCNFVNYDTDLDLKMDLKVVGVDDFGGEDVASYDPGEIYGETTCEVWNWLDPSFKKAHEGKPLNPKDSYSANKKLIAKDIDIDLSLQGGDGTGYDLAPGFFKCRAWQTDCWEKHGSYWITDLDDDGLGGGACEANQRDYCDEGPLDYSSCGKQGDVKFVSVALDAHRNFDWLLNFETASPNNPYFAEGSDSNLCCGDDDSDHGDIRAFNDVSGNKTYAQCLFVPDSNGGTWKWYDMNDACEIRAQLNGGSGALFKPQIQLYDGNGDPMDVNREILMSFGGDDLCCGDDLPTMNLIENGDFEVFDPDGEGFYGVGDPEKEVEFEFIKHEVSLCYGEDQNGCGHIQDVWGWDEDPEQSYFCEVYNNPNEGDEFVDQVFTAKSYQDAANACCGYLLNWYHGSVSKVQLSGFFQYGEFQGETMPGEKYLCEFFSPSENSDSEYLEYSSKCILEASNNGDCNKISTHIISAEGLESQPTNLVCNTEACQEWLIDNPDKTEEDLKNKLSNEFAEFGPSNTLSKSSLSVEPDNNKFTVSYDKVYPFETNSYYEKPIIVDLKTKEVKVNEVLGDILIDVFPEVSGSFFAQGNFIKVTGRDVDDLDDEEDVVEIFEDLFGSSSLNCNNGVGVPYLPMDLYFIPNGWFVSPFFKNSLLSGTSCTLDSSTRIFESESKNRFLVLSPSNDEYKYALDVDGGSADYFFDVKTSGSYNNALIYSSPFDCFTNTDYLLKFDLAFDSQNHQGLDFTLFEVSDKDLNSYSDFENIFSEEIYGGDWVSYDLVNFNDYEEFNFEFEEDSYDLTFNNVFVSYEKPFKLESGFLENRKCILEIATPLSGKYYLDNVGIYAKGDIGWIADAKVGEEDIQPSKYYCGYDNTESLDFSLNVAPTWHHSASPKTNLKIQTADNVKRWDTISNNEEWFYCNADGTIDDLELGNTENGIEAYGTFPQSDSLADAYTCPDLEQCDAAGEEFENLAEDCACGDTDDDGIPDGCEVEFNNQSSCWNADGDECCDHFSCQVFCGDEETEDTTIGNVLKSDCTNKNFLDCIGKSTSSSLQFSCKDLEGVSCPDITNLCMGGYMTHAADTSACCVGGICTDGGDPSKTCANQGGEICYVNAEDVVFENCTGTIIDSLDTFGDPNYQCCVSEFAGDMACKILDLTQSNPVSNASFICYHDPITGKESNPIAECCAGFGCYNTQDPNRVSEFLDDDLGRDQRVLGEGGMLYALQTYDQTQGGLLLDKVRRKKDGSIPLNLEKLNKKDWSDFEFLVFDVASNHPLTTIKLEDSEGNVWEDKLEHYLTNFDVPGTWHRAVVKLKKDFYDGDLFSDLGNKGLSLLEIENILKKAVWPDKMHSEYAKNNYEQLYWSLVYYPALKVNLNSMKQILIKADGGTIAIDNVRLVDKDEIYKTAYCTGKQKNWIFELDAPLSAVGNPKANLPYKYACEAQLSYGWTGDQCCGDDTTWSLTNLKGNLEFYADAFAGCFAGNKIGSGEVVGEVINLPVYENIMFDKGKFYYCDHFVPETNEEYEINLLSDLLEEEVLNPLEKGENLIEQEYCNVIKSSEDEGAAARFCSYSEKWSNEASTTALPGHRNVTKNAINLVVNSDFGIIQ
jgi:hypothetical protein